MTTTIKTTFLTGLFFLCLLTGLQAQDKYEYAKVEAKSFTTASGIYVTISGKTTEEIEVKWKKINVGAGIYDYTPYLDYIAKMTDEGWEVITVDLGAYYLKRKKN